MNNERKEIGYIYSFDIETNQFYDYSAWKTPAALDEEDASIPGAEMFFSLVSDVVAKYAATLPASNQDGSKLAADAYRDIVAAKLNSNPDATDTDRDMIKDAAVNFLDKYYPHHPVKVETYVATFVCIPWDMRKTAPDGTVSGKIWHDYTAEEFKNKLKDASVIVCKSEQEINKQFREIYEEGKIAPNIVLIHNLSYEFNNCIRRLPFFKKMVNENKVKFLSNNQPDSVKSMEFYDRPLKQDGKGKRKAPQPLVYFRDTWKLTSMSIDKLGKVHKFPKLPYEYGIIRDPKTLTQQDFDYNRRDCDIALLAFHDSWTQATEVLNLRYSEKGSVPVSANNIVSSIAKTQFAEEFEKHKIRVQPQKVNETTGKPMTNTGKSHLSYDIYKAYRKVTGGGLVFVNPFFAYTKFETGKRYLAGPGDYGDEFEVKEIRHIDLISAHPSQAFKRLFPTQAPVKVPASTFGAIKTALNFSKKEILETASVKGIKEGLDCFTTLTHRLDFKKTNSKDCETSGFAKFTFKNLKPKEFYINKIAAYSLPCLWASKTTTTLSGANTFTPDECTQATGENLKTCGSKVYKGASVSINLKFEDFLAVVCLFYDFDDFEIDDVYLYSMGPISPYLYKQFAMLGAKKNAYKAINKALDKGDLQAARGAAKCDQVLPVHRDMLEQCTGSPSEIAVLYEMSNSWLSAAKAQFNGVYGSSYQGLERDASILELDGNNEIAWMKQKAKYDEENTSGIDYLQGAYIATWSRVDIALYTYLLASEKAIPLYIATDSVYYLVTEYTTKGLDNVLGLDLPADEYEDRAFNKPAPALLRNRPNIPQIGGMDNENPITVIGYTQALKLICQERTIDKKTGEIIHKDKITFSGTTAEKDLIDEDGNELEAGFFAGCKDIHAKIDRLFQEFGVYTKYDLCTKNKKTAGAADPSGSYELTGVNFINNDPGDRKYQQRKTFADFMNIEEA